MINGCKNDNTKLIIKNNNEAKQTKPLLVNKNNLQRKVLKNTVLKNNNIKPKEIKNNNITFEFRNERLLQGRNVSKNIEEEKTKLALSAVQKMFKKNLSLSGTELNLKNNENISTLNRYMFEKDKTINYQNILVFLPLTGKYSSFGNNRLI